jgi:hypothetical protein
MRDSFFYGDDGRKKYYATYTAYDSCYSPVMKRRFQIKMATLNGSAAVNKGMAMFPRD